MCATAEYAGLSTSRYTWGLGRQGVLAAARTERACDKSWQVLGSPRAVTSLPFDRQGQARKQHRSPRITRKARRLSRPRSDLAVLSMVFPYHSLSSYYTTYHYIILDALTDFIYGVGHRRRRSQRLGKAILITARLFYLPVLKWQQQSYKYGICDTVVMSVARAVI